MDDMTVGALKTHFSEVLERVQDGESVTVLYGRTKKPVAKLVPLDYGLTEKRPIGLYEGKMKFHITDDFKFRTTEEFLGLT